MIWTETNHPGWTPAQAIAAGKTHLEVRCEACRLTVQMPWKLMPRLPLDQPMHASAHRLRCRRCGARPSSGDVAAAAQSDAPGAAKTYGW